MLLQSEMEFCAVGGSVDPNGGQRHEQPEAAATFHRAGEGSRFRRHLVEKVPVSDLCEEHGLHPTLFYRWQKAWFEQGAVVFIRGSTRRQRANALSL